MSMLLIACSTVSFQTLIGDDNLAVEASITVYTDSDTYELRDVVVVMGEVTTDGSPATDLLVSIEIKKPDLKPLLYRTIPIGTPSEAWVLQVVAITIFDLNWNPLDTVKVGNTVYFGVKVYNPMTVPRNVTIVMSIVDGSNIPIASAILYRGLIGGENPLGINKTFSIPLHASPGEARIYVNVYDQLPSEGGTPYIPEASAKFYISRWTQGVFGSLPLQVHSYNSSQMMGGYQTNFTLSSAPEPGDYTVTTVARYSPILKAFDSATFTVEDSESPPQASFVYSPLEPYPNQTVTFDASSSTAEGYGDVIIRYEWDFGDGTPKQVKEGNATNPPDPTITHNFMSPGQYIVTLNVTDTEGYWSTTQKPIYVKMPNPVAKFTWYPLTPNVNVTVTFNATISEPGWSISQASPAPIVEYIWDFNDTTPLISTEYPTIDHIYSKPGNYTVTLTVVDSEGQSDTITHIVEVENKTTPVYDINGDGKINIRDVAIVAYSYGSYPGHPRWNPDADITGPNGEPDGKVDIRDVALVASHFGEILESTMFKPLKSPYSSFLLHVIILTILYSVALTAAQATLLIRKPIKASLKYLLRKRVRNHASKTLITPLLP